MVFKLLMDLKALEKAFFAQRPKLKCILPYSIYMCRVSRRTSHGSFRGHFQHFSHSKFVFALYFFEIKFTNSGKHVKFSGQKATLKFSSCSLFVIMVQKHIRITFGNHILMYVWYCSRQLGHRT